MLNTHFPRIHKDIGNPGSFDHKTIFKVINIAVVDNIVSRHEISPVIVNDFIDSAKSLEAAGADMVTTSCGFLCQLHDQIASCLSIPFVSSALNLLPFLKKKYKEQVIGIITFDSRILRPKHFGMFYHDNIIIQGIEKGTELYPAIKNDCRSFNIRLATYDVVNAARCLVKRSPQTAVILLECTNLSPYKESIEKAVGRPVYDIHSALLQKKLDMNLI